MVKNIITLHIRDVVSKTFHITDEKITLHTDFSEEVVVPEKYRKEIFKMIDLAREEADEKLAIINVHSELGQSGRNIDELMGQPAQRILDEISK